MATYLDDQGVKLKAKKDSFFWRMIGKVFPQFNTFWTTINKTIYYPAHVENPLDPKYKNIIDHELVHVDQAKKYTFPLFAFLYVFFPLPVGLAYFRWKFEREGYLGQIRTGTSIDRVVETLSMYFYPWPKSWMKKWFEENS
jgi:hypothetical protein